MRKKRCRNPLCGRVFQYPSGTAAQCPFCRKPASRSHPLKLTSDELAQVKQLTMPIGELNLKVRAYNCLIRAGLLTVGDITARSESEMKRVRNLGRVSLEEIRGELWKMGLDFKPEQNPRNRRMSMNHRKKRCANPACRKVFAYMPGETVRCPWCGDASRRTDGFQIISRYMRTFRFGVSTVPHLPKGRYMVRLERLVTNKKLRAIKAYRAAFAGEDPGLKAGKMVLDGVSEGRPHVMTGLTADQVMNLMREGQMDLSYRLTDRLHRVNRA